LAFSRTARVGRSALRQRWESRTDEPTLAAFWTKYFEYPGGAAQYMVRHPLATATAVASMYRLPVYEAALADDVESQALHGVLSQRAVLGIPLRTMGMAVLNIPDVASDYLIGSSKQTLRRKIRAANKHGVTCRAVDDPEERVALVELANASERAHPDARYRVDAPDNKQLLSYNLWLAAFDADGQPLLLSVTPMSSGWALLSHFRTFGAGPAYSDSRYLMMAKLVEELSCRGVRHLCDTAHPGWLPNGLRHFQRMIGFRYVRISLTSTEVEPNDQHTRAVLRGDNV